MPNVQNQYRPNLHMHVLATIVDKCHHMQELHNPGAPWLVLLPSPVWSLPSEHFKTVLSCAVLSGACQAHIRHMAALIAHIFRLTVEGTAGMHA